MRVKVLFFARLRELAGRSEWDCEVPDSATVAAVWRACQEATPAIGTLASSVSSAVNEDFAPMDAVVHEGDEVAFLPPVSGGSWD